MGPLSNNSVLSPARHQTGQPTVDGLNAGFDGNVANEVHRAGAEIITPQQTERATILEPSFQLDQSRPTQTIDQDETFKSGVKVAFWATSISASGVTAVWTQFPVNQPISPKCKFFAKAALLSMSASFISGLLIFILSFITPQVRCHSYDGKKSSCLPQLVLRRWLWVLGLYSTLKSLDRNSGYKSPIICVLRFHMDGSEI
ncbi:hypothetical protein CKAN_02730900 [Cinnamomum micranthum f. kanehirae]|uniref:Uncharacterized protein n=1 Tax=Cinnamomum micranthum f. kanehirae TaxID=337451 RepID=A0A3S3RCI1_9MAGN|nr:hypothetical protein CKAN_02730900 [Cinnamomum micranthum f. kanehirae]